MAVVRVGRAQRESLNGHRAGLVYLTGLSGAGKSTLAALLECHLHALGVRTYLLDGDDLRQGLCSDLGFCDADRMENMRRITETARLMVDAGLLVITALIAPFKAERAAARARFAPGEFMEVFVDAPLAVCEARDPKGLYKRARRGEIARFTGIDSSYEAPANPDFRVDSVLLTPHEAAMALLGRMAQLGLISPAPPPPSPPAARAASSGAPSGLPSSSSRSASSRR